MGKLDVDLGMVQYDTDPLLPPVPLAAQVGLAAGAAVVVLVVLVIILMYRSVCVCVCANADLYHPRHSYRGQPVLTL